jgi:hypothetical protein
MRSAALLALLLTACAHVTPYGERVVSDRLFCGLTIPDGGAVTQAQLDAFLEEVVEPRFPQGFTVWRANGQWQGGDEEVMVLEVLRPARPDLERAVAEIAQEYRTRFRQEAVLRVIAPAAMQLVR